MNNQITMLILSCDKFSDLWDGHVQMLERNWPDRDMETFIVTDKETMKRYPGICIINAGETKEWSERLQFALEQVQTPYVFITLDDYFLIKKVNNQNIERLVALMEERKIDYVRLFKRPTKATKEAIDGYPKLYHVDRAFKYSVNLYSGIWKKDFIYSCVQNPLNAWEFEVSLSKMACKYQAECAVDNNHDFVILDVVRKGKLLHNSYFYFKLHPGIYNGKRAVNSISDELRLAVKTVVGRYTPMPVHNAIKRVMRKFGYQFFSE